MRLIYLKNSNQYTMVDDEDYDKLNQYVWRTTKKKNNFRVVRSIGRSKVKMSRIIMNCPDDFTVDHIDHDTLNNRKCNLRICTASQNQMNQVKQRRKCSSIYKGVTWHKKCKKWQSQIKFNGQKMYIGLFKNESKAAKAYDKKAKELFGEFGYLNFPIKVQV